MKIDKLKILGVVATAGGAILTLLGNYVDSKKQERLIDEKIEKKFSQKNQ